MDAAPSALDELDRSCVLHSLGALAVDLQDLVSDLEPEEEEERGGGGVIEAKRREEEGERREVTRQIISHTKHFQSEAGDSRESKPGLKGNS